MTERETRVVSLVTGGTLTLRLAANWMLFKKQERRLLDRLLEAIGDYEAANAGLQVEGCHALQGPSARHLSERASTDTENYPCDDGPGQGAPQATVEVQSVSPSVSEALSGEKR